MVLKSFHNNMIWEGKQVSTNSSILYQKRAPVFPLWPYFTSVVLIGSWCIFSQTQSWVFLGEGCLGSSSLFVCNQEMPDLLREDSLNQWLGCKATTTPILLSSISAAQFEVWPTVFPDLSLQDWTNFILPVTLLHMAPLLVSLSPLPISLLPHLFSPGNTS